MKFHINYGSASNIGATCKFNTDATTDFEIENGHVFVVCDGHDGIDGGGSIASRMTADEIKRYFFERSYSNIGNALTNAISYVNYCVNNLATKEEKYNGIGSTLAILIIQDNEAYYASAGDSRIYFYKDGKMMQLTRDHVSDVNNVAKSTVTTLIGQEQNLKFNVCRNPILLDGDERFLLCTDGLTDFATDDEILTLLQDNDLSAEHKTMKMFRLATDKQSSDNVSVQVVDFSTPQPKAEESKGSIWITLTVVGVLIALFVGIYLFYSSQVSKPDQSAVTKKTTESVVSVIAEETLSEQNTTETLQANAPQEEIVAEQPSAEPEIKRPEVAHPGSQLFHMHVIEQGQNLFRIGLRYNVHFSELEKINGDVAKAMVVGSKLKIPVKAKHPVSAGETLSLIAQRYSSTPAIIARANQINELDELPVGQLLIIPLNK